MHPLTPRTVNRGFVQESLGGSWQKMDIGARMGEAPGMLISVRPVAFGLMHPILFER